MVKKTFAMQRSLLSFLFVSAIKLEEKIKEKLKTKNVVSTSHGGAPGEGGTPL